ncbi:MAG: MBG domain-containing protein, partial [Anaerolineales bacterium]|nr:MBG domain-containing protein [Anaerolineales bacterium]
LSSNYTLTYVGANFTITPRLITVTANAKSKVYGASDPALTYTFTPALVGGDSFSGALSRAAGENVGTYAITQGSLTLSSNYSITFVPANFTITAKPITVTANAKSKVYGDADPALTYMFTPALVGGDSFSGALSRVAGADVGTYAITQGTLALSSNYTLTYVGANFTITPRPITVTADAKSKVYGASDPALTFTVGGSGLASGDTLATVFSGALARAVGDTVAGSPYAITQGTLAANTNYNITSFTPSALTITRRPITVTADAKSKIYGDADPALTYTFTPALVGGDAFTGALTRVAGEAVGTYTITQSTLALSSNYTLTYVGANFTITPTPTATPTSTPTSTPTATPTPMSTVISPDSGGTITATMVGLTTTLSFPPHTVSQPVTITIGLTASQPVPAGFQFLGQTFFVEAHGTDGTPVTTFSQTFTLTIHYNDTDVIGMDELDLKLCYWNVSTGAWQVIPATVDPDTNTLTAVLDHLTIFAVMGEIRYRPLPTGTPTATPTDTPTITPLPITVPTPTQIIPVTGDEGSSGPNSNPLLIYGALGIIGLGFASWLLFFLKNWRKHQ